MNNIDYSFVKTEEGSLTFRSTVDSFGISSVTEKDIDSFYMNFSQSSYLDTGILPVDGTGMLSYRKAGVHEQITYQIKPGIYHINWGKYENDNNAVAYYVAQPYRVVIADLVNGNLLGARTFYSPYPITNPLNELYHVNLPNINCRGYRGNGVGWICLYHNHDISKLPFGEKVVHILERCSGVEAYNDANMSETDGPRFYRDHYKNDEAYSRLWDPEQWQATTEEEGYEWTLDENLWIKVLVQSQDNQGQHDPNGHPLNIQSALLGNYQAYYTDNHMPKPVNILTRPDLDSSSNFVFNIFKEAYNNSSTLDAKNKVNIFDATVAAKEHTTTAPPPSSVEEEYDICVLCSEPIEDEPYHTQDGTYCETCYEETYVFIEEVGDSYKFTDPDVFYDNAMDEWRLKSNVADPFCIEVCTNCSNHYVTAPMLMDSYYIYNSIDPEDSDTLCVACVDSSTMYACVTCTRKIPDPNKYHINRHLDPSLDMIGYHCHSCWKHLPTAMRKDLNQETYCFCGKKGLYHEFEHLQYPHPIENLSAVNVMIKNHYQLLYPSNPNLSVDDSVLEELNCTKEQFIQYLSEIYELVHPLLQEQSSDFNHGNPISFNMHAACDDCHKDIHEKIKKFYANNNFYQNPSVTLNSLVKLYINLDSAELFVQSIQNSFIFNYIPALPF